MIILNEIHIQFILKFDNDKNTGTSFESYAIKWMKHDLQGSNNRYDNVRIWENSNYIKHQVPIIHDSIYNEDVWQKCLTETCNIPNMPKRTSHIFLISKKKKFLCSTHKKGNYKAKTNIEDI